MFSLRCADSLKFYMRMNSRSESSNQFRNIVR